MKGVLGYCVVQAQLFQFWNSMYVAVVYLDFRRHADASVSMLWHNVT
jgi:hypothetical protein